MIRYKLGAKVYEPVSFSRDGFMRDSLPHLLALATTVPSNELDQAAARERARCLFAGIPELERLLSVFGNSGIRRRFSAVPLDWFDNPHSWAERNGRYIESAMVLLERTARLAIDRSGVALAQIGAVITVSTTGIATPSLDALLVQRLDLPADVQRLPIFGLGCAGGAIGLARAAALASTMPNKAVLLTVVELCSLTFRCGDRSKINIVGAALFGDGAAAAVLCCGGAGPAITGYGEHTWPQTLNIMGWDVVEDGLRPVFSRDIPHLVGADLAPAAETFLQKHTLRFRDIDRFICHPGGPKVIDACERAFGLSLGTLADERTVLREFGNMSAATVLFVLERWLADSAHRSPWRHAMLTALGPGFTASFVLLGNR